jgi:amino acid transporter
MAERSSALRRHLGLPDVIAQSVSVIAPAMSGAFLTYLAATKAGGATPLAFLLAALGALAIGGVVSEFAESMHSAGSLYTYTSAGLSKTAGFMVGWMYSLAFIVLAAAVLAGFGFFSSLLFQSVWNTDDFIPWWVFFIAGLVFVAVMSLFNVRISTRTQLVLTAVTVVFMLIVAFRVIGIGSPPDSVEAGKSLDLGAFWPSAAGVPWSGIIFGFAFGILAFTGFEAGAVLAEETKNPAKNIPRAIIGSVVVAGLFYVIVTYATSIGFGVTEATTEWPSSVAGLVVVAPTQNAGNMVLFAAAVASLLCALGVSTAASRFLFAMGREGVLPRALGTTHPKWKTPWIATFTNLVLIAVLVWGLLLALSSTTEGLLAGNPDTPTELRGGVAAFAYWATLATPAVMLCYFLLGLAGVKKGKADNNQRLMVAGVLATITGALAVFGSLYYSFVEPAPGAGILFVYKIIPWVTLGALVIGIAIASYLRKNKPAAWADMGQVFDEEALVPIEPHPAPNEV